MKARKILLFAVLLYSFNPVYSQTPGTRKWDFLTGGAINSLAAIASDGTIYIGSDDKNLYAINPDGTKKWQYLTEGMIKSSPAIGSDGTIYVGSMDRKLYAINPDGSKKWEYLTDYHIQASSPAVGLDGTIYVGSWDMNLHAINPDGTKKWKYLTEGMIKSSPAIGTDGTIYVGAEDGILYAINPDGTKKWEFITATGSSFSSSSPAIASDGTIYVGSLDKRLYAIDPYGAKKWEYLTEGGIDSSPCVGTDGTIYVGSWDMKLHAINSDGKKKWSFLTGAGINSSPAIGADGVIYVGSWDGGLYAVGTDGTKKWDFLTGGSVLSSPSIGSNGIIFIGSDDNRLYAINSASIGLANSSWPSFRHDNFNRGQLNDLGVTATDFATFVPPNQSCNFKIKLISSFLSNITITNVQIDKPGFSILTSLPLTIMPGVKQEFSISLNIPENKLYRPRISIDFTVEGTTLNRKFDLEGLVFLDAHTELSQTAKQAISVWNAMDRNNGIIYYNTKGVLSRLLGEYKMAEYYFNNALSIAINARYSHTGIMMNMGVVKSDRLVADSAAFYFDEALTEFQTTATTSVLAPQIYYNQAWEAFGKSDFTQAGILALSTINHSKSNDYLKAKAYTLLGAIRFSEEKYNEAKGAFNQAITLDTNGPIGEMARENLALTNSVGIEDDSGNSGIRVYPNPSAGEIFISAGSLNGNCSISIFNIAGGKVHTAQFSTSGLSPLKLDISFLVDGLYYIQVISRDLVFVEKIVLKKD
jgi:outer membrane protein assembly factor BamB/tetratricopeptide (TPR) repeat protein